MSYRVTAIDSTVAGVAPSATLVAAKASDIVSTVFSTTDALTGMYGFAQKLILFGAGMAVQNKRLGRSFNPFQAIQ